MCIKIFAILVSMAKFEYDSSRRKEKIDGNFLHTSRFKAIKSPATNSFSSDVTKGIKLTPAAERDIKAVSQVKMSIAEMLDWQPGPLFRQVYGYEPPTFTPTEHATSLVASKAERKKIFKGLQNFVSESEDFINHTFAVSAKSFHGRPPLRIIADGSFGITDEEKYQGTIFKMPSTSLFLVLENEYGPIASTGFNQFSDGIEMRYIQGVHSPEAWKDLSRLGDGSQWIDKLVSLVEHYARSTNLDYSMILPAQENIWVDPVKFPLERAERIYDRTARERGYTYNQKLRRFIKSIR